MIKMGLWMFTKILPVLFVSYTNFSKSSVWSFKTCGSDTVSDKSQNCFSFCLLEELLCLCSHWGQRRLHRQHGWWELGLKVTVTIGTKPTQLLYTGKFKVFPQSCYDRFLLPWSQWFNGYWLQFKLRDKKNMGTNSNRENHGGKVPLEE